MAWDFSTDPEFQKKLDWAAPFVREEVEHLDLLYPRHALHADRGEQARRRPAQAAGARPGLWAAHLGPELGGEGYGQLKLALLNEILGRSEWATDHLRHAGPRHGQR